MKSKSQSKCVFCSLSTALAEFTAVRNGPCFSKLVDALKAVIGSGRYDLNEQAAGCSIHSDGPALGKWMAEDFVSATGILAEAIRIAKVQKCQMN